jgi:hypothetical protein
MGEQRISDESNKECIETYTGYKKKECTHVLIDRAFDAELDLRDTRAQLAEKEREIGKAKQILDAYERLFEALKETL